MRLAFCVTGSGRCGTRWLTSLLDESDPEVKVYHEPLRRTKPFKRMKKGSKGYVGLIKLFEERVVTAERWGIVSGYARKNVGGLMGEGVKVAGLARDGRTCTLSLKAVLPHLTYEQACERWVESYVALLEAGAPVYRLEDLNQDFGTFRDLCDYVGCVADRETWERYLGLRFHVRSEKPRRLGKGQFAVFRKICGDLQETLGYPLERR